MTPPLGIVSEARNEAGRWVTAHAGTTGFRTDIQARGHAFVADEPLASGGADSGPTPYELLLAALSGCTAMTLRMYADRKGWPLGEIRVSLRTARAHEPDCEQCARAAVGVGQIERRVELEGPLTDEQRTRLLQIADRCPVKQTLERGIHIVDARIDDPG